jgi:hypothetical protein
MCGQETPPGGTEASGAGQAEKPQQEECSGFDMHGAMGKMMEHCHCGSEMMAKMFGMKGERPSKPDDPAAKEAD